MKRGHDPSYGIQEQLKNCHHAGMELLRERDGLKKQNAELLAQITELKAMIAYITKGE